MNTFLNLCAAYPGRTVAGILLAAVAILATKWAVFGLV